MKAPINFRERVSGYVVSSNGIPYELGNGTVMDNVLWIYPQKYSDNVLMIEFNWEREIYGIGVARSGNGMDFHTTLPAIGFANKDNYISFDNFIFWLERRLPIWEEYFGFR